MSIIEEDKKDGTFKMQSAVGAETTTGNGKCPGWYAE